MRNEMQCAMEMKTDPFTEMKLKITTATKKKMPSEKIEKASRMCIQKAQCMHTTLKTANVRMIKS